MSECLEGGKSSFSMLVPKCLCSKFLKLKKFNLIKNHNVYFLVLKTNDSPFMGQKMNLGGNQSEESQVSNLPRIGDIRV